MPVPLLRRIIPAALSALLALSAAGVALAQEPAPSSSPDTDAGSVAVGSFARPEGEFEVAAFDPWAEGPVEPRPNSSFTVDFVGDGRLEGLTGCGAYFGGYTVDGSDLGLSIVSKGPDPCGARRTEEAVAFSVALDAVDGWRSAPTGLELLDESGRVRVWLTSSVRPGVSGRWVLEQMARGDGRLEPPPGDVAIILELAEDGSVSGDSGCRLLEGRYEQDADLIAIGPVDVVGLPCEGDALKAERRLRRALDQAVLWDGTAETLELLAGDGSPLAMLRLDAGPEAPAAVAVESPSPMASDEPAG